MAGPGVISFTRTEKYSSLVADELRELRDARVFSDFKICIREESIPCHRLVLSVHSAMLKALLTSDMAEAAKHSVNLNHIDLDIMKVILDYMYVGQVSFQSEQLSELIIACDYLRINMLKDMCVDHVPSILHPDNSIMWLKLANKLDLVDIKSQCLEIIGASFTTIYRQPDFVDLSLGDMAETLSHVQTTGHHDEVLDAALSWAERDATGRVEHLETLVEQIQLDLCSLQGIVRALKNHKSMIYTTGNLYDQLTTAADDMLSSEAKTPTKPTLVIIGGEDELDEVSRVCWKLNDDQTVEEMLKIPFDDLQADHSVCQTPDGFIISGGKASTLCIMFSAETKTWTRLQNLMLSRHAHGSIYVRGVLYVMGGYLEGCLNVFGDPVSSKSVNSLVIEGGNWVEESDLPQYMFSLRVAEVDESVYLLSEDNWQLYQMDIDRMEWSAKAPPRPQRIYYGASMTSFNGKLYLAGNGIFAWYTPATDTWVQSKEPNKPHYYGSLVPYNSKLLLLGGSGRIWGTDEVEEFNFEDNTWSVCTWKLPAPLYHHHALVLDIPEEV